MMINPYLYFYSYTVAVSSSSTAAAGEFDLAVGEPIIASTIVSPTNFFNFYTPGDPFITFTAFDNGSPFVGIAPGSSGTFSFYSNYAPALFAYQTSGFDQNTGTLGTVQGMALAPSAVPEPTSLVLSGLGFCGALGLFARSRRSAIAAG